MAPTTSVVEETAFDETMRCYVRRIEYDFTSKRGAVWIDESDCADMERVIAFFKTIDEKVERIDTFHGERC